VGPRAGLDSCGKMSPLAGFDPRTVQLVAQSLFRLSYPAHEGSKVGYKKQESHIYSRIKDGYISDPNHAIGLQSR